MNQSLEQKETLGSDWFILVCGLPCKNSFMSLAPGISLRPLRSKITVFDLAAAGAVGFREWAMLEPIAPACTSEIETQKEAATLPGYDTLNRAWLVSALLSLRGFSHHLCIAYSQYSWNLIAGHQERTADIFREQLVEEGVEAAVYRSRRDLPSFKGSILDFHVRILADEADRERQVTDEDVTWVEKHFGVFNRLASESEKFRFSLEAAVDWRFSKDPRAAVARLWSGIEAIYGINSELVYRISLLTASLLEPRGNSRKMQFDAVKRLYNLRSKIVHGEPLPENKVITAMLDSYHLLRDLLILTINKGHVLSDEDFDREVFF